ncbi:MAG: HAD family hydrolase [Deltaproteobacteria bacterium]|nr:HAD family hydrolase [Deltaproteobacteria bacterium]
MTQHILTTILDRVRSLPKQRPVVLFDLDGTLYDNRPRTLRILHAFAAQLPREHRKDAEVIRGLAARDLLYRLDETLSPRGVSHTVIEQAQQAWRTRFFTDAACADDVPVAGSVEFVRTCWDEGATVVYLTGRDTPGMLLGTTRTLRDDGFPMAVPRVELVMKPTFEENDTLFKQRLLDLLDALGVMIASFDNEPANCNLFHHRWPESESVFLDTQKAPGAPPLAPAVHSIPTFEIG